MPEVPRVKPPAEPEVLFVGALWRPENEDAALWLLRDIWPEVRARVPGARLTIAGSGPTPALASEARGRPDVDVPGYTESLAPFYQRASVVVSPMRLGAGVKLKSVVAMLWGVPVVATSVGAEGVEGPDVFAAVEDRSSCLAKAIIDVLMDPESAQDVSSRAHAWARQTYSERAYRCSLDRLYA